MDSDTIPLIVALVFLIAASAYFSATETAFSCMNRIRMKTKAENGDKRAQLVLKMSEKYDRLISTILIGNNIVNITASTIGTVLFTKLYKDYGPTVSTVVLTISILIFGEISPKTLAREHAEKLAMATAPSLRLITLVLTPLNLLFSLWKKLLDKLFKKSDDPAITGEELITMVEEAENDGGLDKDESELIRSAIEFSDIVARDILIPRVDVTGISRDLDIDDIAKVFAETGYSRLPVYEEDLDNIVGILHEKDFYSARYRGNSDVFQHMSEVFYTTPNTDLGSLLKDLQKHKTHLAIIVDEYGGTEGLITLEDILEEIVGDIYDEHDEVVETFKKQDDGGYLIDGTANLTDLYDLFSVSGDCEANTIAGWIMNNLGRIPTEDEEMTMEGLNIKVLKSDHKRILEVYIKESEVKAVE